MDIDFIMNGGKPKKRKQSRDPLMDLFGMKSSQGIIGDRVTRPQRRVLRTKSVKSIFGDWDGDGVINGLDCQPRNSKKHRFALRESSNKDIRQLERITKERHGPMDGALDYPLSQSLEKAKKYPSYSSPVYDEEGQKNNRIVIKSDKRNLKLIVDNNQIKGALLYKRVPARRQTHIHAVIVPKQFRKQGILRKTISALSADREIDKISLDAHRGTTEIWRKVGAIDEDKDSSRMNISTINNNSYHKQIKSTPETNNMANQRFREMQDNAQLQEVRDTIDED